MCLAAAAKIIKIISKDEAAADFGGLSADIKISLLKNLKAGDYVLVHAGFAISKISKKDAEEITDASKEAGII